MPGKKEDLRHAEAGADPDLTFGYNDLLEELKRDYGYNERQSGDISTREMAEALGLSVTACRVILQKKIRAGEIEKVKVKGVGDYNFEYVYRRVKK